MFTLYAQTSTQIAMSLPAWLDLASVTVGGISGALVAKERKLDPIGFIGLSMLCGLGGGLVRDMAMQVGSVYMLDSPYAIPATVAIGLAVFFFGRLFEKVPNLLEWVDIISVGLFALGGTDKAIVHALLPVSAILMGTLTGVGGGMLRDVMTNTMPKVLRKRVYAVASLIGGGLYYVMHVLDINQLLSVGCGMLVIFALRLFATIYKWNLPSVKLD